MKFNQQLETLLKTLDKFTDKEGDLLKQNIKHSAEQFDNDLIKLLFNKKDTKTHFFDNVGKATVFNYRKFIDYIDDKNFLIDSYTKFSNKVGLTVSNKHLQQINEVVLSFPFKDCVLEGGQSKDDEKRKEIFFNEVLAKDEINRLLDKKVITSAKKYTQDGISKKVEFKRDENGLIKDNLIIKGNNLLALHTLKSNFAGKVKLIYIDPPYNTGNDSFNYNDNFNHSTWLTFMKNRLEVAKDLLSDDGVIFVQCDDNEQAYLKVLMDEIFGRGNFISTLPTIMNLKGNQDQYAFAGTHEYILVWAKNKETSKFYTNRINDEEINDWQEDEIGFYKKGANLKATGTNAPKEKRPNLFYPIYISKNNEISLEKNNISTLEVLPITDNQEMSWRWSKKLLEQEKNNVIVINNNGKISLYKKQRPTLGDLPSKKPKTIFYKPTYSSGNGTAQIKKLFGEKYFEFSKPEELMHDIIEIATKKGDLVLDYHLGSGTTCAVAHKMGRQYIGIEQMDYIEDIAVKRMQKVIEGEQGGISKSVDWAGGGEFIYFELDKYNQKYIDEISNDTDKTILKLYDEILDKAFLNYDVESKKLKQEKDVFKTLSLSEQQEFLISILNKNQLYKNLSEIDDKDLKVDKKTKGLNTDFYEN